MPCAGAVLLVYAFLAGARWPATPRDWVHAAFSGVLLHAIYLGSVWVAVKQGVPASISALLAALQPILTAALAPFLLHERIGSKQWLGIVLGFVGIILVLSPKLGGVEPGEIAAVTIPLAINVVAMLAVTLGTFYQKRYIHSGDLRTVTILQYAGALAVTLPFAYLIEPMRLEWNTTTILVMLWSVFAISIGAIALLLLLIRRGEVHARRSSFISCRRRLRSRPTCCSANSSRRCSSPGWPSRLSASRWQAAPPEPAALRHRHRLLDVAGANKTLVVWLRTEITERELRIHLDFQRLGRDVGVLRIDIILEHEFDRRLDNRGIEGREFLFGDLDVRASFLCMKRNAISVALIMRCAASGSTSLRAVTDEKA